MRLFQLSLITVGLMVVVPHLTGCGSSGTVSGTGGSGGSPSSGSGGSAAGGGHAGNGGAAGGGGSTATGGTGGGAGTGAVHDCFPPCIANLRKSCERPRLDGGTCVGTGTTYCYSNGIREVDTTVDGGGLGTFTEADGTTPCYQVYVVVTSAGVFEHYQTASGQEVAVVGPGDGGNTVTCNGTTTTVAGTAACETLTEADCTAGSCP